MDFFPPIVDDPWEFGQVAAANSLSDVYAMGGTPISALNLLAVPSCLDTGVVRAILQGGNDKVLEAGINVSGGHSIEDSEPKFGLSVLGLVAEDRLLPNSSGRCGDYLILTKALGSGILTTADKAGLLTPSQHRKLIETMALLNRKAMESFEGLDVSSCTDITGFGLMGHTAEMASASGLSAELHADAFPIQDGAPEMAAMGIIPAAAYRNRAYIEKRVRKIGEIPLALEDVAYDPQTSGGLLIAIAPGDAGIYVERMQKLGQTAAVIGRLTEKDEFDLTLTR